MDEFIERHTECILKYKKSIFTQKTARSFIQKLTNRQDETEIEKELNKCLLNGSLKKEYLDERKQYIFLFLKELKEIRLKEQEQNEKNKKNIPKINGEWMPFMKMNDENFPSLSSSELVKRKKNFVVLDRHYQNKLEPGIKECFCMSTKHPLVGNCIECGRIHCLQEGDKVCIYCGAKLINKQDYKSQISYDNALKNANLQKDKLLSFQKEFYSKLQIVDDFSDWYEVSNNTWLDEKSRQEAKKKDEESVINEKAV